MRYTFNDFIGLYEDVLTQEQCDSIINYFENCNELNLTQSRQESEVGVDKTRKDDLTLFHEFTKPHEIVLLTYPHLPLILDAINYCYSLYSKEYDILNSVSSISNSPGLRIQKTKPGQGYHVWHYEQSTVINGARLLAWTIYLNDVEEGGETEFLYQKRRIYPKRGSIVIWPSGFTHTHRGNPPLSGDKYIATSWIQYTK
jgi:hypothetical protein